MVKRKYNLIERLKTNKPKLGNPDKIRTGVLNQIKASDTQRRSGLSIRLYWFRSAAAILLLLGIGNLAYQEFNTRTAVLSMQVQNVKSYDTNLFSPSCSESLRAMVDKLKRSSFYSFDRNTYLFTLADVAYLEEIHSPYLNDVKEFVKVLEQFYPQEYIQFMSNGETKLSILELSNDHRVCELFSR